MNVADIADRLSEREGLTKTKAKEIIEGVLSTIVDAATAGEEISLPGFGKFKVTSRAAREGRNPATGATINIAASKKLTFAPAKALKDALNPAPAKKGSKKK
jgi:DNA-binding protein HU-beta